MIGANTNLLVRHLTEDDPVQARRIRARLAEAQQDRENVFISHVVLSELCWALASIYGFDRQAIERAVKVLLDDGQFAFEDRLLVESAVEAFPKSGADFPDHLIGLLAERAGAQTTYTFDKKAAKLPGFTLLK